MAGGKVPMVSITLAALANVNVPALVIAGGRDEVAPPKGCRRIYEALGGPKTWHECTVEQGFSKDFSHSQMISRRSGEDRGVPVASAIHSSCLTLTF
ncbi:MAG: hypothetical protein BEV12_24225 [Microcystis aeruginosa CACIAM 03]|nr:MAG: hypothetical protein BEV12_24225 [Microcystis aeruginosa CACIAM 03]